MKILWVEDFNNGKSRALKSVVLDYYQLDEKNIEIIETFDQALAFMGHPSTSFDLVILDIKGNHSGASQAQYDTYFQNYVSKSFYDAQMDSSDTGILLYMYLREVKNFPKERIAFLSAFLDSRPVSEVVPGQSDYGHDDDDDDDEEEIQEKTSVIRNEASSKIMAAFHKFDENGIFIKHQYYKPPETPETPTARKAQEENCNYFQNNFITPNRTNYVVFRRNIMEIAKILQETFERREKNQNDLDEFLRIRKEAESLGPNKKKHTIFSQKKDEAAGVGRDVYQPDYFYDLLSLTMSLPLDPEGKEKEILLSYLKNLLFCGDCMKTDGTKDVPNFDLASAIIIKKARNSLSHGNGREAMEDNLLEMKEFIVPLFFRLIFQLDSLKNKDRESYLTLEKNMISVYRQGDLAGKDAMVNMSKKLHQALFQDEFSFDHTSVSKTNNISLNKDYDSKLKNEKNLSSFGRLFLTRNYPATLAFKKSERDDLFHLWIETDDNTRVLEEELYYLQMAYFIAER